jgi:hypothetical protein
MITGFVPQNVKTVEDWDGYIALCKERYVGISRGVRFLHWLMDDTRATCLNMSSNSILLELAKKKKPRSRLRLGSAILDHRAHKRTGLALARRSLSGPGRDGRRSRYELPLLGVRRDKAAAPSEENKRRGAGRKGLMTAFSHLQAPASLASVFEPVLSVPSELFP